MGLKPIASDSFLSILSAGFQTLRYQLTIFPAYPACRNLDHELPSIKQISNYSALHPQAMGLKPIASHIYSPISSAGFQTLRYLNSRVYFILIYLDFFLDHINFYLY